MAPRRPRRFSEPPSGRKRFPAGRGRGGPLDAVPHRRIALVSDHASPLAAPGATDVGGQNVYVAQVARHLAARGHEVDVFTRREDRDTPEVVAWLPGVRVIHVDAGPPERVPKEDLLPAMDAFTDAVVVAARVRRYDLLHANFFMSGLVAAEVKRRLGIPFVVTFHALGKVRRREQGDADRFPEERIAIEERIVREADRIVAECPQDEEDLIRLYGAEPVRIEMVPAGFDPEELGPVSRQVARRRIGVAASEDVVLHVGRLVPRKGIAELLEGFARFREGARRPTRLLVVGGDPTDAAAVAERDRLEGVARDLDIADAVRFEGPVARDRLRDYYSAADLFATTPWYEPFGITPVEAMACGTPVIGTNVGGIRFTVRDGETGYLVPPRDPAAIADRLTRAFAAPGLLRVFRAQAVRRANAFFTWDRIVEQLEALYERTVPERHLERLLVAEDERRVSDAFVAASDAMRASASMLAAPAVGVAVHLADALARGATVFVCGNGGSAAESQHLAAELVGRFRRDRCGLRAIALTTDTAVLTAWANDASFDDVFARQVSALGRAGDVLVALSTSGRSRNVLAAARAARERGMTVVALGGLDGGALSAVADLSLRVPSTDTQRIQEAHLVLVHVLAGLVEDRLAAGAVVEAAPPASEDADAATAAAVAGAVLAAPNEGATVAGAS
jgi:D-inositol-3-phosphate glycosyltransferase